MAFLLSPPDSRDSLSDTLADLGRSRKTVALAAGLFTFVAVLVGSVLLACRLDSWFHLPPLARGFALTAVLALAGVAWARGVSRAVALRSDPLSVALELEEKFPGLNDSLASAVSFLEAGDAEERGVSNRLQDVAVKLARRGAARHDFDRIVPSAKCWRRGWVCGVVVAVALPVALVDAERAAVALTRLADPFGHHTWPTKTRVEVLAPAEFPARMPRGDAFDLKFAVRGVVKDRATVAFRVSGGDEFEESFPLALGNDPKFPGAAVVTARIDPGRVPSSFEFKIASNDFTSPWMAVNVVPPPRLVPFAGPNGSRPSPLFHVTPPGYTGLAPFDLPDGATVIEVPVGSAVQMRAVSDVRLASAGLVFTGNKAAVTNAAGLAHLGHANPFAAVGMQSLADEIASDIPVSLDDARKELSAYFAPALSGTYAFRLTDETGLTGVRLLEVRVLPDPPPAVSLFHPEAGKDPPVLTPAASLPVHVAATDKTFAVRRTFLEYRVNADPAVRTVPLLDVRDASRALPAVVGNPATAGDIRPVSSDARRTLPLSAFTRDGTNPLRPGDTLLVRGAADDWDDVTAAKEPGRSGDVEIRIESPESVEAWLERELAALRPDVTRTRNQQRDARQGAGEVSAQPDGTLAPADRDRLLGSEQTQRLIRGKVGDPRDGLRAKTDMLLETVRANNLPRSNATERVTVVAEVLGRLADRDLPVIEPALSNARQAGSQTPQPGQEQAVPELLKVAARHQKAAEDGLTDVLDLLSVWGGAGEIRGEARVLRDFVLRQAGDIERMDAKAQPGDLDRAGTRAEQAADQGNQLIGRATRLAGDKDKEAAKHRGAAAVKTDDAAKLRAKAAPLPPGTPGKSVLNAQAATAEGDAADLKAAADRAAFEANALRNAIAVAEGQSLPDGIRGAAATLRKDQRVATLTALRTAVARLDRMIEALTEKPPEAAPDLVKLKKGADDVDSLAGAQDDIRHRAVEAANIADPVKRAAEFKKLAGEQERLIERSREVLQRLTRDGADSATRDVRAAVDNMQASRADLENGNPGVRPQTDAVENLDNARDRMTAQAANAPQQLSDEKRRKMAEKVKALLDRQKAAVAEAERVHKLVAQNKGWQREYEVSYLDVAEQREAKIADELRELEKEFAPLPVLARVLSEAGKAMTTAGERITDRLKDIDPALAFDAELESANDRRVKRPMDLAARRLQQLLDALKPDDPKAAAKKSPPPKAPDPKDPAAPPPGGGNRDLVPPAAQMKVLRALQAELNQQTAEFAKLHPDSGKLTDEQRAELKEQEDAQREIAALFEQVAKLLQEQKQAAGDDPENPAPEKP